MNQDPEKAAAFEEEHPDVAFGADLAGSLLGQSPVQSGVKIGEKVLSSGQARVLMGTGQAALSAATGDFDPNHLAMSFLAGAAAPGLNRVGGKLWGQGQQAAGKFLPGRPDQQPAAVLGKLLDKRRLARRRR